MSTVRPQFDFDHISSRRVRITPEIIQEMCQRIVDAIQPQKIVLFGSQAKGVSTKNSDLDLLIIVDKSSPIASLKKHDRYAQILRMFPHKGFGLDAIVLTDGEVQKLTDENEGEWDFVLEILHDGKTLYERKTEGK